MTLHDPPATRTWADRTQSLSRGPALSAAVLVIASALISIVFWPGHMDADALNQISEARSGRFNDWWAPVLDWLGHGLYLIHLSPGFVLWATITIFLLSVYELLRVGLRRRWSVTGALLIAFYPPVLGYLVVLQRDTWFAASTLGAYACVALSQKTTGARRVVSSVGVVVAVWISLAARQNALIAVLPVFFTLGRAITSPRADRRRRSSLVMILLSVICLVTVVLSQQLLTRDVIKATRTYPQQFLIEGDLAALSLRTGKILLPPSVFPSQQLRNLRSRYSPYTLIPLLSGHHRPLEGLPGIGKISPPDLVDAEGDRQLEHAWVRAIVTYPGQYLHARWKLWTRLISWSGHSYAPYLPGFDHSKLYTARFPSANRLGTDYLRFFSGDSRRGGILDRVWIYLLLSISVAADLLRRGRSPRLRVIGWLCAAAAAYYLAFFFLAMAIYFRFAWFLVAATTIGVTIDVVDHARPVDDSPALAGRT
jgi:hypothetical protein